MLQASGLVKSFGGFQALAGCSLEIARQSITGIIGPNGAGKSTLFNVLGGLMLPEAGDVTFDGRSILRLRPDERARIGVVRTFQISRELGELTVLENMLLAAPHQYGEALWRCFLMPSGVRDQERAAVAKARARLEQVNLWNLANESAKNLSGGQKKLLELARVLVMDPSLILLDEPVAGVNPTLSLKILSLIEDLRKSGKTFFLIEHDMNVVFNRCDRVIVMHQGRVIAEGKPAEVRAHPAVLESYLGG